MGAGNDIMTTTLLLQKNAIHGKGARSTGDLGQTVSVGSGDDLHPETLELLGSQRAYETSEVVSSRHPLFTNGYRLIKEAYPPDQVDPKQDFVEQVALQRRGELAPDAYHFLVARSDEGNAAGVVTFNYLAGSSVAFENYSVAPKPEIAETLLSAMEEAGIGDAAKAGKSLFCVVIEADPKNDLPQRGMKAVPLPHMQNITDPTDHAWVKEGGKVVGIRAEKVREIVQDMYKSVYEKDLITGKGTPTTQYAARFLKSLEGRETTPLVRGPERRRPVRSS
ncbi:MAG: hypothetical protein HYU64_09385 [Armatimonadetes bacterium]|nr:hypothetical protein [Armatimonadota bacterium]